MVAIADYLNECGEVIICDRVGYSVLNGALIGHLYEFMQKSWNNLLLNRFAKCAYGNITNAELPHKESC